MEHNLAGAELIKRFTRPHGFMDRCRLLRRQICHPATVDEDACRRRSKLRRRRNSTRTEKNKIKINKVRGETWPAFTWGLADEPSSVSTAV
jgi:hypothetical protein